MDYPFTMLVQKLFSLHPAIVVVQELHYLIDAMDASAYYPEKWDKVNRHLTAIQMSLSNGGWFTLRDLMEHNRPWTKGLL